MTRLTELINLRLLVGYLGEAHCHGWWNTQFLNTTGQRYLAFNFPRSAVSAGLHATSEAACRLHDEHIGRGRVFHLFRLPTSLEQELHALQLDKTVQDELLALVSDQESAMGHLSALAASGVATQEGPVQVGTETCLTGKSTVPNLAAHYLNAFRTGIQTFPYFKG
jgi:hypothetical protein